MDIAVIVASCWQELLTRAGESKMEMPDPGALQACVIPGTFIIRFIPGEKPVH